MTTQDNSSSFRLETVQELEQHGANAASLGSITSWGMKNIVIAEGELRQLLDEHDLEEVKIPAIRQRKALNRALKEMVEDELIRLLADTKEKIVYVLVKISNDVDLEEVRFARTLKVTYRKDAPAGTDPLTFSSTIAEQILRPLIDKYRSSYVSNDISRFILLPTVKACGGISLRPEGGIYFVPAASRDVLLQLRSFTESLAKRQDALAYLSMFNIIDDDEAKQDMQRHAHDALKAELRDLGHLLAKLHSNPERTVRAATIEKYLEEAERIAQEASLYRDLILLQAEDITAELNTLRQQFRAVVSGEATFGDDPFADDQAPSSPTQVIPDDAPLATQTAIPHTETAPSQDFVSLQAFADLHGTSRNEAVKAWQKGFIRAKKEVQGNGKQQTTLYLDTQGRRSYWVQFHEAPGFRACNDCPHALRQDDDVPF